MLECADGSARSVDDTRLAIVERFRDEVSPPSAETGDVTYGCGAVAVVVSYADCATCIV